MCVGAVTDATARFNAKVTDGTSGIRVHIADNPEMAGAVATATETVNGYTAATCEITGLTADTRYWWQVEDSGTLDTSTTGQFVTDPAPAGTPASFTIGLWGDAGLTPAYPGVGTQVPHRSSFHPVFATIRERALAERWRRIVSLGDEIYYNLGSGSFGLSADATVSQFRAQWDDIFLHEDRHALYRDAPWVYAWDDHDFGPNDSDSTDPGRDNVTAVYRERCPSYDLPAGTGSNPIYHSFNIGRILFVVSDTRSDRTDSTVLGATQTTWLENTLNASNAAALVWLMPTPWLGEHADSWAGHTTERSELADLIADTGWSGRTTMLTADIHAAAIASGAANPYGGWPITLCASVDATTSGASGSQYDVSWRPGRGQYATLRVDDLGSDIALTSSICRGSRSLAWHTLTVTT